MSALIVLLPARPVAASTEFDYAVTNDGSTVAQHGTAQASVLPAQIGRASCRERVLQVV